MFGQCQNWGKAKISVVVVNEDSVLRIFRGPGLTVGCPGWCGATPAGAPDFLAQKEGGR